jgi:hypothetical protein
VVISAGFGNRNSVPAEGSAVVPTAVLAPAAALWAAWLWALLWGAGRRARPLLPASTPARRRRLTLAALVALTGPAWAAAVAWGGPWTGGARLASVLVAADLALLVLAARRRQVLARVAQRRAGRPGSARPASAGRAAGAVVG